MPEHKKPIVFLGDPKITIFEKQDDPYDKRLKNIIHSRNGCTIGQKHLAIDVGLVGMPFDWGVKNSGGRIGAARAPDVIREQLKKYGTAYNVARKSDLSCLSIADLGNFHAWPSSLPEVRSYAEGIYAKISRIMARRFQHCNTIISLGGGNDLSFASVRGLRRAVKNQIAGMNVDAHLDVRAIQSGIINSGAPYRLLIERRILAGENFFEVGIQGQVNSKVYWDWAKEQGIRIFTLQDLRQIKAWGVMGLFRRFIEDKKIPVAFVSIDIDSVTQAFAPGCSAPNPDGLFPQDVLEIAYTAGTIPQVKLFEIMEVNPLYDQDNRTSRLAANIILEFLAGYTQRKKPS